MPEPMPVHPSLPRAVAAHLLVVAVPLLAWLVWVSGREGYAGDAAHVGWFATVALGVLVAGFVAPPRTRLGVLALLAVVATMVTLWGWWSSEDESGLFVIGIVLAAPLVALAAPVLLLAGRALSRMGSVRNRA
jgi:hypothetical protein